MLIPIRNDHRYQASAAADRAQQRVSEFNIQNAPAYDRPDRMDDWSADYLAAIAEIVVAEYLEQPWGQYELKGVDVGANIEVRRTGKHYGGLTIYQKDYEDQRIGVNVLVYMENDTQAHLVGWVDTEAGWVRGRHCAETRPGCCAFYRDTNSLRINRKHLRPINQLPERPTT